MRQCYAPHEMNGRTSLQPSATVGAMYHYLQTSTGEHTVCASVASPETSWATRVEITDESDDHSKSVSTGN